MKRWFMRLCLLGLVAVMLCMQIPAFAAEPGGSISMRYSVNEVTMEGVGFSLYRVANVDDRLEFRWTEEYAGYQLALDPRDEAASRSLAGTLRDYISRDGKTALATTTTDAGGRIRFDNLEDGLYLVTGESIRRGNYTYRVVPVLLALPFTAEDQTLARELTGEVKHTSHYHTPWTPPDPDTPIKDPDIPVTDEPGNKVDITVRKLWDAAENANLPGSIQVDLLKEGLLENTVTLSAATGWTYTWHDCSDIYRWSVIEHAVPEGFEVSVETDKFTTTLTNRQTDKPEDPSMTPEPTDPPTDIPDPDVPYEGDPKLPQTGMVQWPITVLCGTAVISAAFSALFGVAGLVQKRRNRG